MTACEARCEALGYPTKMLHFESFGSANPGQSLGPAFEVEVEGEGEAGAGGRVLKVPEEKTLLDVLNDAGFDVPSSCEAGRCGICAVEVCEGSGKVEHKGTALGAEPEKSGSLLTCVSMGVGRVKIYVD
jgi:ferredoxin